MLDLTPAEREIAERCAKATAEPWCVGVPGLSDTYVYREYREFDSHSTDGGKTWQKQVGWTNGFRVGEVNDAQFIAHARQDIPLLLATLRHERQLRAELEAALQDLLNAIQWWREGGITAEGCQQAEQKARAALNPQPESEREIP
jgi:hypothetical protein